MGIQLSRLESPVGSNDMKGLQSILNFATKGVKSVICKGHSKDSSGEATSNEEHSTTTTYDDRERLALCL